MQFCQGKWWFRECGCVVSVACAVFEHRLNPIFLWIINGSRAAKVCFELIYHFYGHYRIRAPGEENQVLARIHAKGSESPVREVTIDFYWCYTINFLSISEGVGNDGGNHYSFIFIHDE